MLICKLGQVSLPLSIPLTVLHSRIYTPQPFLVAATVSFAWKQLLSKSLSKCPERLRREVRLSEARQILDTPQLVVVMMRGQAYSSPELTCNSSTNNCNSLNHKTFSDGASLLYLNCSRPQRSVLRALSPWICCPNSKSPDLRW